MNDHGKCGDGSNGVPGVGCGEPFIWEGEKYRCVDCGTYLHAKCAKEHWKRSGADVESLRQRAERAEAEEARLTAKVNALGDAVEEEGRRRRKAESADWNSVLLYRAAESRAVKAEERAAGFECELLSARAEIADRADSEAHLLRDVEQLTAELLSAREALREAESARDRWLDASGGERLRAENAMDVLAIIGRDGCQFSGAGGRGLCSRFQGGTLPDSEWCYPCLARRALSPSPKGTP